MNDDMKIGGWALNSEYFCSILHELREDVSYRAIVDKIVKVPEKADTRDTAAIKRIATAYLKLFFPNVRAREFEQISEHNHFRRRAQSNFEFLRGNGKFRLHSNEIARR